MIHDISAISAYKIQSLFRGYRIRKLLRLTLRYYLDICQSVDACIQITCPNYSSSHLTSISHVKSNLSSSLTQPVHTPLVVSSLFFPSDLIQKQLIFTDKRKFDRHVFTTSSKSNFKNNANLRKSEDKELTDLVREAEWLESAIFDRIKVNFCLFFSTHYLELITLITMLSIQHLKS